MATKKATTNKLKHPKMDRLLVSTEPHEIQYLREKYYKVSSSGNIEHPTAKDVRTVIKEFNNSRINIGRFLISEGFKSFRAK